LCELDDPALAGVANLGRFDIFEVEIQVTYHYGGAYRIPWAQFGSLRDRIFHGHGFHPALNLLVLDGCRFIGEIHEHNLPVKRVSALLRLWVARCAQKRKGDKSNSGQLFLYLIAAVGQFFAMRGVAGSASGSNSFSAHTGLFEIARFRGFGGFVRG